MYLVEFFAPWCGHCKALVPEYEKAAAALKGVVRTAAVDADAAKSVAGEQSIKGFPTIKFFFSDATGKTRSSTYEGARTAEGIVEWAMAKASKAAMTRLGGGGVGGGTGGGGGGSDDGTRKPRGNGFYPVGSPVVTLNADDFASGGAVSATPGPYLVEFYAPWCPHCQSIKGDMEQAARSMKGRVSVGAVDCDAAENKPTCGDQGVEGFPTIKLYVPGKRSGKIFKGERSAAAITEWALSEGAAFFAPPKVHELTSHKLWSDACLAEGSASRPVLCVVSFVPAIHNASAASRSKQIADLREVAKRFVAYDIAYFWAVSGEHPDAQAALGLEGPGLVGFSPSKQAHAQHLGATDVDSVSDFMSLLTRGKVGLRPLAGSMPAFSTVPAWDGKDWTPPPGYYDDEL